MKTKKIYEQVNLIAHRGLSSEHWENTLASFKAACKAPFFGVETDLQYTLDGKIICFHDATTERLFGVKKQISELKYNDIKKLTFLSNTNNKGERVKICTFQKYLQLCKKHKKKCIIEIKCLMNNKQLDQIIRIIKWHRYLSNCIIISFHSSIVAYLRKLDKSLKLQYLVKNPIKHYFNFCVSNNIDASLYEKLITKERINKLHASGIKVAAWTVNDASSAQKLVDMGIDFITSNFLL